ncbi:hypothetical protein A5M85_12560 [Cellulophaga lytica]|nr:hypothetical protein A5M85_12560 [Cellulophaga lytica]
MFRYNQKTLKILNRILLPTTPKLNADFSVKPKGLCVFAKSSNFIPTLREAFMRKNKNKINPEAPGWLSTNP